MTTWIISGVLGFVAGAAVIWFAKPSIQQMVIGANALSAKLHAQANAISAAAKKL